MKLKNFLTAAALSTPVITSCASSQKQEQNPDPLSEFNERIEAIMADAGDSEDASLKERLDKIFPVDADAADAETTGAGAED